MTVFATLKQEGYLSHAFDTCIDCSVVILVQHCFVGYLCLGLKIVYFKNHRGISVNI